jgi:hypothetical protein
MLKATEEKSRIRIRIPLVRIRGSASISKRHGSGTPDNTHKSQVTLISYLRGRVRASHTV